MDPAVPRLDPREEPIRIDSPVAGLSLFLRGLAPANPPAGPPRAVLYVHGATFPSALSIAHRFDGRSWRDALGEAGFHVWGLDFLGFGGSDRYPEMAGPAEAAASLGTTEQTSRQLEAAVRFVCGRLGVPGLSLVAHSQGSVIAGHFAGRCPDLVDRLVLFGPIAQRHGPADPTPIPAWTTVSLQQQWDRFTADTPDGEAPVLLQRHFRDWGERYLDSDAGSHERSPPAVRIPTGPRRDIAAAWSGRLPYDPALIRCPVAIIRGAWDSLCTDADAAWLFDALAAAPLKRDIKLSRGGHLMHLEEGRAALHREATCFLQGGDTVPESPVQS
jgi:pimeloyl-ACP methyl ester carboxylesterase